MKTFGGLISLFEMNGGIIKFIENEIRSIKYFKQDYSPSSFVSRMFDITSSFETYPREFHEPKYKMLEAVLCGNTFGGLFEEITHVCAENKVPEKKIGILGINTETVRGYRYDKQYSDFVTYAGGSYEERNKRVELIEFPLSEFINDGLVKKFASSFDYNTLQKAIELDKKLWNDHLKYLINVYPEPVNISIKEDLLQKYPIAAKVTAELCTEFVSLSSKYLKGKSDTHLLIASFLGTMAMLRS